MPMVTLRPDAILAGMPTITGRPTLAAPRIVARRPLRRSAVAAAAVLVVAACGPGPSSPPPTPSPSLPAASPTAAPGSACAPAQPVTSHDWNDRVWYEAFVRSFADGNGDGIGDFRGLTAKLDYLNDGDPATTTDGGIWLMPIMDSPSYHGYDVVDYRKVEPDYGTRADFKAFLAAAHERGIKVIVDLVLNHTSSQNPWFQDAAAGGSHHDWYVWSDTNPHWPSPTGGGDPWHRGPDGEWYYGVFSAGMPDLNLRDADATAAVTDAARFWLDEVGVDGFRLDAARHLIEDGPQAQVNTPETLAWLATFKGAIDAVKPDAMTVGEVWDIARTAGGYVPDSLDLTFDFPMAAAIRNALQTGRTGQLQSALGQTLSAWPANQEAAFLTNHDQDRILSQLNGDVPSARLAAWLLLTGPGVPFVYYGEEIGMQGRKPDERIRTPMQWSSEAPAGGFADVQPWEPLQDDWRSVNVAAEDRDPGSLLSTYRDLIRLRNGDVALQTGETTVVDGGSESVMAWLRFTPDRVLLAVANVGTTPVTDYGLSLAEGPLCGPVTAALVTSLTQAAGPPTVAAPSVTVGGGFDAYRPLPALAPRSGYLIALDRSK
jgi:glycosidase